MVRPRNIDERARIERKARERRIEAEEERARQTADAEIEAATREALADWDDLVVKNAGGIWSIDGYYKGRRHLGARQDVVSLIVDLKAAAVLEHEADALRAQQAEAASAEAAERSAAAKAERARLDDLERRLKALENQTPAAPETIIVEAPPAAVDPLDPSQWRTLEEAKAALLVLVRNEAARRVGYEVTLYERMVELDTRLSIGSATRDEELELEQHQGWAEARSAVELARQLHVDAIAKLTTLEEAKAYRWDASWPEV